MILVCEMTPHHMTENKTPVRKPIVPVALIVPLYFDCVWTNKRVSLPRRIERRFIKDREMVSALC